MINFSELIDVNKSPLTRIMSVFDETVPGKRAFENNICATHIGNGIVISVAHSIFPSVPFYRSIEEKTYQEVIISTLSQPEIDYLNSKYVLDSNLGKRFLNIQNQEIPKLQKIFKKVPGDRQYCSLYKDKICKPFLIFNFDSDLFFENDKSEFFDSTNSFYESNIDKHSFLIELELLDYDFKNDFAIYKIKDDYSDLIKLIPSIDVDFSIRDNEMGELFCLQGAHANNLGRMINRANIEGYIDQFSNLGLHNGKMHFFEGLRYLIKGYFRFGSSGAPYIFYNSEKERFYVNAIQSEACPQQLKINNNRNGHEQYINAIATPLLNVKEMILQYI